jgi:hypothetical protein
MGSGNTNDKRAPETDVGEIRDAGDSAGAAIASGIDASSQVRVVAERVRAMVGKGANGVRNVGQPVRTATGDRAAAGAKEAIAERVSDSVVAVRKHRGRLFVTIATAVVSACVAALAGLLVRRSRPHAS